MFTIAYPYFARQSAADFAVFHPFHTGRMAAIVALPMVVPVALEVALLALRPAGALFAAAVAALACGCLVLATTAFLQVPLHGRLIRAYDRETIARLVRNERLRFAAAGGQAIACAWAAYAIGAA